MGGCHVGGWLGVCHYLLYFEWNTNRDDGMTSGKLVSFLLLLSSLSDAFNNMGSIFSAFTQALGAADKGTWSLDGEEKRGITLAEKRSELSPSPLTHVLCDSVWTDSQRAQDEGSWSLLNSWGMSWWCWAAKCCIQVRRLINQPIRQSFLSCVCASTYPPSTVPSSSGTQLDLHIQSCMAWISSLSLVRSLPL